MISSTVVMIICIAGIWMTSRVADRPPGPAVPPATDAAAGTGKPLGRHGQEVRTPRLRRPDLRPNGVVTAGLVLRGATVFAAGKPDAALGGLPGRRPGGRADAAGPSTDGGARPPLNRPPS